MKRVYISGKITGYEYEAVEAFAQAELEIMELGFEPVNPMRLDHKHGGFWIDYMREDIRALIECDGIYMLKDWDKSKGARVELTLARGLGLSVLFQSHCTEKRSLWCWQRDNFNN